MHIEGEYIFDGPRDVVWEMLNDPKVLAAAMPGTKELKQVEENKYEGIMNVRVGPVSGSFSGTLVVADPVPPETCTLKVDGRGGPGFLRGEGQVHLT
ncbi:MAG: CoxG family protein, partial [Anaerolineae bacterium]